MSSIFAEKKLDITSRSVAHQNTVSSMAAVPALQRKEAFEDELQMKAIQLKKDTIQRLGEEEELPVQGKFIIQKQSGAEEEPLQMKAFQLKTGTVQKEGLPEDELLQKKPFQLKTNIIQKAAAPEEELPVQGKFESIQKKENKTGLPDNLKSGVESLSGLSMDDVNVHYNSSQPAQLNALAYAQGTDIHVAPGQEKHLPHEAWHVAQQKQGRVQPTMQMKAGVAVNDDPGLENEADVMGAKAVQMVKSNSDTIQRAIDMKDYGDSYRSSGSAKTIKKKVNATIAAARREDMVTTISQLTTSIAARKAMAATDKIHLGRIKMEEELLEKVQNAYDALPAPVVRRQAPVVDADGFQEVRRR